MRRVERGVRGREVVGELADRDFDLRIPQAGGALPVPQRRDRGPGPTNRVRPTKPRGRRRRLAAPPGTSSSKVCAPSLSDLPHELALLLDACRGRYPNPNPSCSGGARWRRGGALRWPSCPSPASTRRIASGSVATSIHFIGPPQRTLDRALSRRDPVRSSAGKLCQANFVGSTIGTSSESARATPSKSRHALPERLELFVARPATGEDSSGAGAYDR